MSKTMGLATHRSGLATVVGHAVVLLPATRKMVVRGCSVQLGAMRVGLGEAQRRGNATGERTWTGAL